MLGRVSGGRLETVTGHVARGEWYQLLSARADGWTAAVEMIRRSPIGGVGAGGYSIEFYPARLAWLEAHDRSGSRGELATHFEWAHCDPLQLAAETGLLGAVWMVTLLALLWRARPRGDPVVAQMAAAAAPFALLHYPLSLAVGLLPLAMATARVVSTEPRVTLAPASRVVRRVSVVAALLITLAVAAWQARRIAVDVWQGAILAAFDRTQAMPVDQQRRALAALEAELSRRAASLPSHRAWLLRKIGLVRLARGDAAAAEAALRQSMELWPHEETELGLGVAMDRQGRRTEALAALGRVLRVNPALIRLIPDEDLRRAAEDLVTARRRTHRATGG